MTNRRSRNGTRDRTNRAKHNKQFRRATRTGRSTVRKDARRGARILGKGKQAAKKWARNWWNR